MTLPKVIEDLVKAQNELDSAAYANCFSETALVFDEGHTHKGRTKIKNWIAKANDKYRSIMEPIDHKGSGKQSVLTARVTGTFNGSPIVLKYHFEFKEGLIQSLEITG